VGCARRNEDAGLVADDLGGGGGGRFADDLGGGGGG